jgi:hypothetical protein
MCCFGSLSLKERKLFLGKELVDAVEWGLGILSFLGELVERCGRANLVEFKWCATVRERRTSAIVDCATSAFGGIEHGREVIEVATMS